MSTRAHTAKAAVLAAVGAFVLSAAPAVAATQPIRDAGSTRLVSVPAGATSVMRTMFGQAVGKTAPSAGERSLQDRMGPRPPK